MSKLDRKKGAMLAAAAATLFIAAPFAAQAHGNGAQAAAEPMGMCMGGNSCKGQSACKTAKSSCKGQNACKGQGFTKSTKAECDKAGGEFKGAS